MNAALWRHWQEQKRIEDQSRKNASIIKASIMADWIAEAEIDKAKKTAQYIRDTFHKELKQFEPKDEKE